MSEKLTVGELVYKISGDMDNLKTELKKAEAQIGKLEQSMEKSNKTTQGFVSSFRAAKAAVIGFVTGAVVNGIFNLVKSGAELNQLQTSFARLSAGIGLNSNDILMNLQKLSAGTISNKDLILSANRAITLGVAKDMGEFSTLMQVARIRAADMGLSTQQAFDNIVTGIGRSSPLILDNLGIVIKQNEAYETYARSLNKTAEALTDNERREALKFAVLEQSRKQIEEVGEVTLSYADRVAQVTTMMQNWRDKIGVALLPAFEVLASKLVGMGGDTEELTLKVNTAGREFYRFANLLIVLGKTAQQVGLGLSTFSKMTQIAINEVLKVFQKLRIAIGKFKGDDVTELEAGLDAYTTVTNDLLGEIEENGEKIKEVAEEMGDAMNQVINPTNYSPVTVDQINQAMLGTAGAIEEAGGAAEDNAEKIDQFQAKLVSLVKSAQDAREKLEGDLAGKFKEFGDALKGNVEETVNSLAQIVIGAEDEIKRLKDQLKGTDDTDERKAIRKQIKEQEEILASREDFEERQAERIAAIRTKLEEAGIDATKAGFDNLLNVRTLEEQIEEERRLASLDEFQRFEEQQSRKLVLLTDSFIGETAILQEKIATQKEYEADLTAYLASEDSKRLENTDTWATATIAKYQQVADSLKNLLSTQAQIQNIQSGSINPLASAPAASSTAPTQNSTNNTTNNNVNAPVTINGQSVQNLSAGEISAILGFELNKYIR